MQRKKKQPDYRPWHPDFRDLANLPDIKTVKTNFLLNVITAFLLVAAALFYWFKAVEEGRLETALEHEQSSLESEKPRSDAILELNNEYQREKRRLTEVANYINQPFLPSQFLWELSDSAPERLQVESLQYDGNRIILLGRFMPLLDILQNEGTEAAVEEMLASTRAFSDELETISFFGERFDSFGVSDVLHNQNDNTLSFRLTMVLK